MPGNTNRILFASNAKTDQPAFARALDAIATEDQVKAASLKQFLTGVRYGLRNHQTTGHILTDDKAPVELLGMRAIDQLVSEELAVYKEMYREEGLQGIMDELL